MAPHRAEGVGRAVLVGRGSTAQRGARARGRARRGRPVLRRPVVAPPTAGGSSYLSIDFSSLLFVY